VPPPAGQAETAASAAVAGTDATIDAEARQTGADDVAERNSASVNPQTTSSQPTPDPAVMRIVAAPHSDHANGEESGTPTARLFADLSPKPEVSGEIPAMVANDADVDVHDPQVQPAAFMQESQVASADDSWDKSWQQQLAALIQQQEQRLQTASGGTAVNQQVRLQLLQLAAGLPPATDPASIAGHDDALNEYWNYQLQALATLLDETSTVATSDALAASARRRQMTQACQQLQQAHSQLSGLSTLQLAHCAFASEVRGFGQFTPLPSPFQTGQQALIYCEIENYSVREADMDGQLQLVAKLQGQYTIVDATNRVVYQHQYQPVRDMSLRRRRDFYMFFPVTIPDLPPGQYRLQLSVEDLVGNKVAAAPQDLVFQIGGSRPDIRPGVARLPSAAATHGGSGREPPLSAGVPAAGQPPLPVSGYPSGTPNRGQRSAYRR
jgi:hypothetical protein